MTPALPSFPSLHSNVAKEKNGFQSLKAIEIPIIQRPGAGDLLLGAAVACLLQDVQRLSVVFVVVWV